MTARSFAPVSFGAIVLLALTACGGGKSVDGSATASAAAVAPAVVAAPTSAALSLTGDILATEGNRIVVTGTAVVQYGSGDRWVSRSLSAGAMCNAAAFGADPAPNDVKVCQLAGPDVVALAVENAAFTVSGTQTVQYGAASSWTTKSVSGNGMCSNAFFAGDPISGVAKTCRLTNTSVTTLVPEGSPFTVSGMQVVQYGARNSWITRTVNGSGTCSDAFFGANPIANVAKACVIAVKANPQAALASEGAAFTVAGTQTVQYGAGDLWVGKTLSGNATCTAAFFGSDPAPGTAKTCRLARLAFASIVPGVVPASPLFAPKIDTAKIPAAMAGFDSMRVTPVSTDPNQNVQVSDIGAFREYCEYSHMSYDDPIVFPGVVGKHLHTFMGNTGTDRNSTASSIANSGNSTCAGGIANRTSYWFPSMIDTRTDTPIAPIGSLIYYKQNYNYVAATDIHPFPPGLRMVAGNPASTGGQGIATFGCTRPDGSYGESNGIPTDCAPSGSLLFSVMFPQCWDGVNLDSPDHQSHMTYPSIGCPASHPVALTGITFKINFPIGPDGTTNWRLSSDSYDRSLPGGYSAHADWFDGWERNTLDTWTTRCINASTDCHAFLIGDGRSLY